MMLKSVTVRKDDDDDIAFIAFDPERIQSVIAARVNGRWTVRIMYVGGDSYEMVSNDKRDAFSIARVIQNTVNGPDERPEGATETGRWK